MTEHTDHLEIVVRGSARGRYRPERGIIHLAVRVEGADKSAVYTRETRRDRERELRRAAVDDAIVKAQAYSDAVGRGPVVPVLLSDPDMAPRVPQASRRAMPMAVAAGPPPPSLELRTDDIEIGVAVDARFRTA